MPVQEGHYYGRVTAKGRVTLPADLRQRLGIRPGDIVELSAGERDDGPAIEVRRRPSMIEATAGIARPKAGYRPPEWHEVDEVVTVRPLAGALAAMRRSASPKDPSLSSLQRATIDHSS